MKRYIALILLCTLLIMLTACNTEPQKEETVSIVMPKVQETPTVSKETEYVMQKTEFYRENMKIQP